MKAFKPAFQSKLQGNDDKTNSPSSVKLASDNVATVSSSEKTEVKSIVNKIRIPGQNKPLTTEVGSSSIPKIVKPGQGAVKIAVPGAGLANKIKPVMASSSNNTELDKKPKLSVGLGGSKNMIQKNSSVSLAGASPKNETGSKPLSVKPLSMKPLVVKKTEVEVDTVAEPAVVEEKKVEAKSPVALKVNKPVPMAKSSTAVKVPDKPSQAGEHKLKTYFSQVSAQITLGEDLLSAGLISQELFANLANKIQHTNHTFDHLTSRNILDEIYKIESGAIYGIIDYLVQTLDVPYYDLTLFDFTADRMISLNTAQKLGIIVWQKGEKYIQVSMLNPQDDDLCEILKDVYGVREVYKGLVDPEQLGKFYMEQKIAGGK